MNRIEKIKKAVKSNLMDYKSLEEVAIKNLRELFFELVQEASIYSKENKITIEFERFLSAHLYVYVNGVSVGNDLDPTLRIKEKIPTLDEVGFEKLKKNYKLLIQNKFYDSFRLSFGSSVSGNVFIREGEIEFSDKILRDYFDLYYKISILEDNIKEPKNNKKSRIKI